MLVAASVVCALVPQQLQVEPYPAEVGAVVTVTATTISGPASGLEIEVALPDGGRQVIGTTDAQGRLTFVPPMAGQFVYAFEQATAAGGVRVLAPHRVVPRRERWWLAFGSVPLGLALLWRLGLSRGRGRRGP